MVGYSRLERVLVITTLPRSWTIKQGDNPAHRIWKSICWMRLAARQCQGTGILTSFPSSRNSVGVTLRTGLLLADDALPGKPCPSGGRDSHPTTLLLPPGSTMGGGPQDLTALLLPTLHAHLPHTTLVVA